MRLKGILITLVILLAVVFAAANWSTLSTPLPVNFLLFRAQVPLGFGLLVAAVLLSAAFFLVSLVDRAGQLRQVSALERRLETLRAKLDARRLEEIEQLEKTYVRRCDSLEAQLSSGFGRLEGELRESLASFEMRTKERLGSLQDRVVLVRNELAADIAEAEDTLKRQVRELPGPTASDER